MKAAFRNSVNLEFAKREQFNLRCRRAVHLGERLIRSGRLTLESRQLIEHFVGRRYDFGSGRVSTLDDDHVGKLLGEVDSRLFQSGTLNRARAALFGGFQADVARLHGAAICVAVERTQTIGV